MKLYVCVFFVCFNIYGQLTNYDKYEIYINKGDSLRHKGDYKNSIVEYQKALKMLDRYSSSTPFFNLAECAIKSDDIKLAEKYICLGVSKGGAPYRYLISYEGFSDDFKTSFEWKNIIKDFNDLRKEYFSSINNIDVYIEIEKMIAVDQYPRKIDFLLDKEFLRDKEDIIDSLMIATDNKNIKRLIEITKEYGWQDRAWLLLWHHRGTYKEKNYVWDFFIPFINNEIEQGRESRGFWVAFEDDKSLREKGYTLYGSLPGKIDENINNVNNRRKEVNMPVLSQEEIDEYNNTEIMIIE